MQLADTGAYQRVQLRVRRTEFDFKHYSHVIYGNSIAQLKGDLRKRVAYHLANPAKHAEPTARRLQFTIAGTVVAPGACIDVRFHPIVEHLGEFMIVIGINNTDDAIFERDDVQLDRDCSVQTRVARFVPVAARQDRTSVATNTPPMTMASARLRRRTMFPRRTTARYPA